jgi:hypothetical protein
MGRRGRERQAEFPFFGQRFEVLLAERVRVSVHEFCQAAQSNIVPLADCEYRLPHCISGDLSLGPRFNRDLLQLGP